MENHPSKKKSGRDEVLARIKNALADVRGEQSSAPDAGETIAEIKVKSEDAKAELIEKFRLELEKVGGNFFAAADGQSAADYLSRLLKKKNIKNVVGWSLENLSAEWLEAVFQSSEIRFYSDDGNRNFISICEKADAGVTCADFAVAETGTLVLLSGEKRARSVSLLPPIHVALVKRENFVADLTEFFARSNDEKAAKFPPSAITFITGPSRTADIELKLVVGVHAAQELYVVTY